jgi:hypothetical protein
VAMMQAEWRIPAEKMKMRRPHNDKHCTHR